MPRSAAGFLPVQIHYDAVSESDERFRRIENGSLQYDVTVEDPNVFTRPWVLPTRTLPFRPEVDHVDEFVCETSKDYDKLFDKK